MPNVSKMRATRMKSLLKQNQAAKIIGISKSYLCRLEQGDVMPTDDLLRKMGNLYRCHQSDLI